MKDHHLFLSCARLDNRPKRENGQGWVDVFCERLKTRHKHYAGRHLEVFFDKTEIQTAEIWENKIYAGLRSSRLFLAFLSPNYLKSEWCRREWEEYLRLEHTLARGDGGITPIYFVEVPELSGDAEPAAQLREWIEDVKRRQLDGMVDLRLWYDKGPDELMRLDAEDRLAELRAEPHSDAERSRIAFAGRIANLDEAIAKRLDDTILAELAADMPGIDRSYENFVGRSRELRDLHRALLHDQVGLIAALHGLGGQGKTALAVQYAYAYAGHYACGGRWQVPCENVATLAEALERLADIVGTSLEERWASEPEALRVREQLRSLKARTFQRQAEVERLRGEAHGWHSPASAPREPIVPRMLVILDNVSEAGLLSADALAPIAREDWLEVIVTTRLDPDELGDRDELAPVAVDDLPPEDGLAMLRPKAGFADEGDEAAAREIVTRLGGMTLALDLVRAHVAAVRSTDYRGFLQKLDAEGLVAADDVNPKAARKVRAEGRAKRVAFIVEDTLATLPYAARTALEYATFFPPDDVVTDWLRDVVATEHPELAADAVKPGEGDAWEELIDLLNGRRLLVRRKATPGEIAYVSLHRVIGAHLRDLMGRGSLGSRRKLVVQLVEEIGFHLENVWLSNPSVATLRHPLVIFVEHYLNNIGDELDVAIVACVCAGLEMELGKINYATHLIEVIELALEEPSSGPTDKRRLSLRAEIAHLMGRYYSRRAAIGDRVQALAQYETAHALREEVHRLDTKDTLAAQNLNVSRETLGDALLQRWAAGDEQRALALFKASLAASEVVQEAKPGDREAALAVSTTQEKLGDFYMRRSGGDDAARAQAMYEASLSTRRALYEASQQDAKLIRALSFAYSKLGWFYLWCGHGDDRAKAIKMYEASLKLRQPLVERYSDNWQIARELCDVQERGGTLYRARAEEDDLQRSIQMFGAALVRREAMRNDDPDNGEAVKRAVECRYKLAQTFGRMGNVENLVENLGLVLDDFEYMNSNGKYMDRDMHSLRNHLIELHDNRIAIRLKALARILSKIVLPRAKLRAKLSYLERNYVNV